MGKRHAMALAPNSRETAWGFGYLAFQLLLLPVLLTYINAQVGLSDAELNFVFYLINFIAMLLIFPDFLQSNLRQAARHPVYLGQAVVLGLAAYYVSFHVMEFLLAHMLPGYANYNDAAIAAMSRGNFFLMAIGTVILVPPVEECLYRGLIFRNLYGKSPLSAYLLSILAFSCIHIIGYIGQYSAAELLAALLQYLPAGLWLAWSYTKADSIFAPILIHAAVNCMTISGMR